jgi:hypothetical protein
MFLWLATYGNLTFLLLWIGPLWLWREGDAKT